MDFVRTYHPPTLLVVCQALNVIRCMKYRMRNKKSTHSNSHMQEEKEDNTENISNDYAENIVNEAEQPVKEDNENTVMNSDASLSTLSEQSPITDLTNLEIQDIEGIGPTTAKKLREAGIFSVMDLAVAGVENQL